MTIYHTLAALSTKKLTLLNLFCENFGQKKDGGTPSFCFGSEQFAAQLENRRGEQRQKNDNCHYRLQKQYSVSFDIGAFAHGVGGQKVKHLQPREKPYHRGEHAQRDGRHYGDLQNKAQSGNYKHRDKQSHKYIFQIFSHIRPLWPA